MISPRVGFGTPGSIPFVAATGLVDHESRGLSYDSEQEGCRMPIKQRIVEDLTAAMKSGEKERLGVLRMVKAEMLKAEVNLRGQKGRDYQLEDPEAMQVLVSYA